MNSSNGAISVPDRVERGLDLNWAARRALADLPSPATDAKKAARMRQLAEFYEREVRWWELLINWVYSRRSGSVSLAYGRAAIVAQAKAQDSARRYWQRELYWLERSATRATRRAVECVA